MKEDLPVNRKLVLTFALSLSALAVSISPAAGAHASRVPNGQERQRAEARSRRRPAKQRKDEKKQEASYTCPMHPDVHQKSPGECPVCGMELDLEKPAAAAKAKSE